MIRRQKVFWHTSFFKALLDNADPHHSRAALILEELVKDKVNIFTSYLSILETFQYLQITKDPNVALIFMQAILSSNIGILFPTKRDLNLAYRYLKMNQDKNIDCLEVISSIYMQRMEIEYIMTFEIWHDLLGSAVSPLIVAPKFPELSILG